MNQQVVCSLCAASATAAFDAKLEEMEAEGGTRHPAAILSARLHCTSCVMLCMLSPQRCAQQCQAGRQLKHKGYRADGRGSIEAQKATDAVRVDVVFQPICQ